MADQGTDSIAGLRRSIDDLAEIADRAVPKEQFARTLRTIILVAAATLVVTLTTENLLIKTCFLNPPAGGPVRTACGAAFPGWEASRRQADERLTVFTGLVGRVRQLEDDSAADAEHIAELENRLHKLETGR